jgi:hypothetical protein
VISSSSQGCGALLGERVNTAAVEFGYIESSSQAKNGCLLVEIGIGLQ